MRTPSLAICIATLLIVAPAGAAPSLRTEGVTPSALAPGQAGEYLVGVVLVMLALGAFAFVMRRLQMRIGGAQGALRVCAALPLGGKERIVIVEAEGERLLLGVGAGGVKLLRKLKPRDASPALPAAPGNTWLSRTLNGGVAR